MDSQGENALFSWLGATGMTKDLRAWKATVVQKPTAFSNVFVMDFHLADAKTLTNIMRCAAQLTHSEASSASAGVSLKGGQGAMMPPAAIG